MGLRFCEEHPIISLLVGACPRKLTAKLEVAERETKVRQDPADEKADMCSLRIVIIRYFS